MVGVSGLGDGHSPRPRPAMSAQREGTAMTRPEAGDHQASGGMRDRPDTNLSRSNQQQAAQSEPSAPASGSAHSRLLLLQRSAGNRAVASLIGRSSRHAVI